MLSAYYRTRGQRSNDRYGTLKNPPSYLVAYIIRHHELYIHMACTRICTLGMLPTTCIRMCCRNQGSHRRRRIDQARFSIFNHALVPPFEQHVSLDEQQAVTVNAGFTKLASHTTVRTSHIGSGQYVRNT